MAEQRVAVQELMVDFATHTGLMGEASPRRYLWSDAFAVCNYLELYRQTGNKSFLTLALRLVDQVHHILGRHREDDPRTGWIGSQSDEEGERHPTQGGLRIGKKLSERRADEPYDRQREWDRDGQYYHYLTRWMHALNRVSQDTGDRQYNRWARELARGVHAAFVYQPHGGDSKRIYWKMSIDLSRPLVASMGHHDPLDGYLTYLSLQVTATSLGSEEGPDLSAEIADMAAIAAGKEWATVDALGLGGLLTDAYRSAQLVTAGALDQCKLPAQLLDDALVGLQAFTHQNTLGHPPAYRLAFRELGLAIGIQAIGRLQATVTGTGGFLGNQGNLARRMHSLVQYLPFADSITTFWQAPENRLIRTWLDHRGINMVMLATSLAPTSYLTVLTPLGG